MDDYPIKIGKMLFTMVDPHRGYEKAYNRWYERDHFYGGCMIGPGWFSGSRWVSPRELKDLRFPADSTVAVPLDAGSYLAVYWVLKDQEDPTWAGRQVQYLYANGRGFDQRSHVHTGVYDYVGTTYADDDGVPVELALDHRYPGMAVVFIDPAEGVTTSELRDAVRAQAVHSLLAVPGIDMVVDWLMPPPEPRPALETAPGAKPAPGAPGGPSLGSNGGSPDRLVQLAFVEGDPKAVWDQVRAYAEKVEATGKGLVTFGAPFYRTVVGTDKWADQLW